MKIFDKIFGIILNIIYIILIIVLIIVCYYMFQIKIQKKEFANIGGYTFFKVVTGSMTPTINVNDLVIIKITKDIVNNDIIVYNENDNFITHRLLEKNENMLLTKGDANSAVDEWFPQELVIGKVIYVIPRFFIIRQVLLSPQVLISFILLVIFFTLTVSYKGKEKQDV